MSFILSNDNQDYHLNWKVMLKLYRGPLLIILHTFLIGVNIYGWRLVDFIFEMVHFTCFLFYIVDFKESTTHERLFQEELKKDFFLFFLKDNLFLN